MKKITNLSGNLEEKIINRCMKNVLKIEGRQKLFGETQIDSCKNAVLPILAACILCNEDCVIENFPFYSDTLIMLDILKDLGAKIDIDKSSVRVNCSGINKTHLSDELACKIRASVFCLGPLISKFKHAKMCASGGCRIGKRPIDLHIDGLKKLNINVVDDDKYIEFETKKIKNTTINLAFPSVGATENLIMASVLGSGTTIIKGCAKEVEIVDLVDFLKKMGAKIKGAGSSVVKIVGVKKLCGCTHAPIPDRIITGTYLCAVAICGGKICLKNVNKNHIKSTVKVLKEIGCKIKFCKNSLVAKMDKKPKNIKKLCTMPFPLFPTDMQPQIVAVLSTACGKSFVQENIFESRFEYVKYLNKMGANIVVKDNTAKIFGVEKLKGKSVRATDLRGGAALVIAALFANGTTYIENIDNIERGYYNIENHLRNLGAKIEKITKDD